MRPGQLFMDPKRMIEACDENTIGVVPTFGVTYTGNYEFPQPLHDALDKFQADTGIDIDMHIDAASGGFLAPFVAPDIVWDFRLPRVKSISASGHKFGLAPLGCGWVIWRDEEALPQELVFNVDYLGGQIGTFAINFSRPAGQVIAQYYEFLRLGREGYIPKYRTLPTRLPLIWRMKSPNWGRMSSSVPVARTKASRRFASN